MDVAGAAFVGFVYGYLGLPLVFFLIRPIVDQVLQMWRTNLAFSRFLASFVAFFLLIILGYGSASVWLDWFARHDPLQRIHLGKVWVVWLFVGLVAFALIPRLELQLRKHLRTRRKAGKELE